MTDLINLNNFLNNAIGFESFFERFNRLPTINAGFPHYNIKKAGEDNYILEIAEQVPHDSEIRQLILAAVMCIDMILKE